MVVVEEHGLPADRADRIRTNVRSPTPAGRRGIRRKAAVFVQVDAGYPAEIDITLPIPVDQLLINAERRGARSQPQNAARKQDNLRGDDIRRLAAHIFVIGCFNDFHVETPF